MHVSRRQLVGYATQRDSLVTATQLFRCVRGCKWTGLTKRCNGARSAVPAPAVVAVDAAPAGLGGCSVGAFLQRCCASGDGGQSNARTATRVTAAQRDHAVEDLRPACSRAALLISAFQLFWRGPINHLAVTFKRTNRFPVEPTGRTASTVRFVPLSAMICCVTPAMLQERVARVSLHSTT